MSNTRPYGRAEVEVSPSQYDSIKENNFFGYNPAPSATSSALKDAEVGDSVVFRCDKSRINELERELAANPTKENSLPDEYRAELEMVVDRIEDFNPLSEQRVLYFRR